MVSYLMLQTLSNVLQISFFISIFFLFIVIISSNIPPFIPYILMGGIFIIVTHFTVIYLSLFPCLIPYYIIGLLMYCFIS
jgi:hypothetical protein